MTTQQPTCRYNRLTPLTDFGTEIEEEITRRCIWPSKTVEDYLAIPLLLDWREEKENYLFFMRHTKNAILDTMTDDEIREIIRNKRSVDHDDKTVSSLEHYLNIRTGKKKDNSIDIAALKARINIHDVIEHYVGQVNRRGRSLIKCPLPNHKDGTPSFMIYPDGFKCFGCGKGGDAISFVQEMTGCGFKDAIQILDKF